MVGRKDQFGLFGLLVLFNYKNLNIFRIRVKEGLSKVNTLWSIIGLKE